MNIIVNRLIAIVILSCALPVTATTITDAVGEHNFDQVPQRVISLSWTLAENLVELGVTPLAIADPAGYQQWVVKPALPNGTIDVGTRNEPNIERIAELKPDIILLGDQQDSLVEKLATIAPVLVFHGYSADHNNEKVSEQIFFELAKLFDRVSEAKTVLEKRDQQLKDIQTKLQNHFGESLPEVATLRFNNASLMWIYGDNSMPQYALERIGIRNAVSISATQWGVTQQKITELGNVKNGIVLHIEPFDQSDNLFSTPLWKAMPFVRTSRFAAVESTWTYGGPMSILYLAEAFSNSLLTIEP